MRLDLDSGNSKAFEIRSYDAHKLQVNEDIYESSIIITPITLIPWNVKQIKDFTQQDVNLILELNPEVIIIGTGATVINLEAQWASQFLSKKIGTEVMTTAAACRTYNVLLSENRHVVAALIV